MALAVVRMSDNASLWEVGREQGVKRWRYVTHPELVKEVCPECLYYHDTVWDEDDPLAPEPPLHPMCACTREPEFDPGSVLGQDPDGEPIVAEPAPELKPGEYLDKQLVKMPAEKQRKYIGAIRTTLLRAGIVEVKQLIRRISGLRSTENLLRSTGLTREDLRTKSYAELQAISARRLAERRKDERRRRTRRKRPTGPGELGGGYFVV